MTARPLVVACALLAAAGHAQAQTTLVYRYDQPTRFRFAVTDTMETSMESPMGPLNSTIGVTGRYSLELTPRQDSTHVKLVISDYQGTVQAMGQTMPVPTEDMAPIEIMLSRRGGARLVTGGMPGVLAQVPGAGGMIARMFVMLPAQPVAIGATWRDTITVALDSAGMKMNVNGVSTATYAADTTVNGRRMHRLHVVTDMVITGGGNAGGMDVTQDMKGVSTADWLWDPERRIFAEVTTESTTTGVMTMSAMGTMNIRAKMRSRMKLVED